jgi:hypothetical protein
MPSRSTNCKAYYDTVSLLVDSTASVAGREATCSVDLPPVFSCQKSVFERPDQATEALLREKGLRALQERGCAVSDVSQVQLTSTTNLVGAQAMEYSPDKLSELGMTSNCFREGNDPNHATHIGSAKCFPQREMTDSNGNRVMNTNMQVLSSLSVCDTSEKAMPQVMEDLRKVAAASLSDRGYQVDKPEDLACTFSVLPSR